MVQVLPSPCQHVAGDVLGWRHQGEMLLGMVPTMVSCVGATLQGFQAPDPVVG